MNADTPLPEAAWATPAESNIAPSNERPTQIVNVFLLSIYAIFKSSAKVEPAFYKLITLIFLNCYKMVTEA